MKGRYADEAAVAITVQSVKNKPLNGEQILGFVAATKNCLSKWNKFSGRASRSEFWWWFFIFAVLAIAQVLTNGVLSGICLPLIILWLPICLAVGSRRLHDMDRTARWLVLPVALLGFGFFFVFFGVNLAFGGPHYETAAGVFFFGSLASGAAAIGSTVFFSAAGTTGTNRYGDTPKLHGKRYGG